MPVQLQLITRRGGLPLTDAPAGSFVLPPQGAVPVPWHGMRTVLGAGATFPAEFCGEGRGSSTPASLTYPSLQPRPLLYAIAGFAAERMAGQVTLFIPNVFGVDCESLYLIQPLFVLMGERLRVVIGVDEEYPATTVVGRLNRERIERTLRRFGALVGAESIAADGGNEAPVAESASELAGVWVDGTGEEAVRVCRWAFDVFGAGFAATLAERLLLAGGPWTGELHAMAGLAGSQIAGLPSGRAYGERIGDHFRAAVASEDGDFRFPYLLCRLAAMEANGKNFAGAAELIERAAVQAVSGRLGEAFARYLDAWVLNGRALQSYRAGRKGDAVAQVEGALAALAGCPESDETPAYHRHYSRVVLCLNMTRVYVRTGDLAAARVWYARLAEAARALPAWQLAELNEFAVLLLEDGLEEAATSFAEQRDQARAWLAPDLEADAEQLLGQTLFRLGRAREAFGCFRAAERLHAALGQDVFGMKVNAAFAALRGGLAAEAYSLFVEVEAGMEGVDLGEVWAAQALARAMGGERDLELEGRAEAALFAEGSAADARVRGVAMLADAVGRDAARELVERAVDSVGDGELAAEDGLGLWVRAVELGVRGREEAWGMAEQARGVDDANVWWEIRRLEGVGEPVG